MTTSTSGQVRPRLRTPVCDLLGIELPIVGAGMGGLAGPELAAAISEAGGLGTIGAGGDDDDLVIARLRDARLLTTRPLAVNFVLEVVPPERIEAVLDEGVDVLCTGWGAQCPGSSSAAAGRRGCFIAWRRRRRPPQPRARASTR